MHQDIEGSLAASSISHAGGPQSPARSAENLLNGHRPKGLLELGRRDESVTDAVGMVLVRPPVPSASHHWTHTSNPLSLGGLFCWLKLICRVWVGDPQGPHGVHLSCSQAENLPVQVWSFSGVSVFTSDCSSFQTLFVFLRVEEDEEEEEEQEPSPLPTQVILRRKPPSITNRLTSRKSAPVLNQIFEEEGESDDDFDLDEGLPPKLSRLRMNMGGSPGTLSSSAASSPGPTQKRYHRRKSQGRGSSCSSSETSDDDSESHRRRLDKDAGFGYSWNRRDSSEGPPGSSGGNGGGSGAGQSKPPGGGGATSGPDKGSPPGADGSRGEGGGGGGGGGGSGGGGGGGGGKDSPSSCCNNSSTFNPSLGAAPRPSRASSRSLELVESLKLMSLCLSSQLQQQHLQLQQQRGGRAGRGRPGEKFIIPPHGLSGGSVKIQEKSSWRMCIGSAGSLDTITLPTTAPQQQQLQQHPRKGALQGRAGPQGAPLGRDARCNLSALKSGVLQLPLYEKTISVNIQRGGGSGEGLLCAAAPASCCQVI